MMNCILVEIQEKMRQNLFQMARVKVNIFTRYFGSAHDDFLQKCIYYVLYHNNLYYICNMQVK